VTGVQARDGTREHARVVIGADGRNSHVARLAGAPVAEDRGSLSCWYFSYWSGVESNALEISVRDHTALFAFPTDDDLLGLFVAWPLSELRRVKADVEGAVTAAVDAVPFLGERVRAGRREERFYGATQLPNIIRRPYGPGWALAGDAACHKDPFLALGVCDALRDAELLAEAIPAALEDGDLDAALERYGAAHEAATRPDFEENLRAARLDGLDDRAAALFAALRGREADTRDFFLAREGMIDPASFFTPARLGPILAG
jgi:flavin-dependent dehydrogenase